MQEGTYTVNTAATELSLSHDGQTTTFAFSMNDTSAADSTASADAVHVAGYQSLVTCAQPIVNGQVLQMQIAGVQFGYDGCARCQGPNDTANCPAAVVCPDGTTQSAAGQYACTQVSATEGEQSSYGICAAAASVCSGHQPTLCASASGSRVLTAGGVAGFDGCRRCTNDSTVGNDCPPTLLCPDGTTSEFGIEYTCSQVTVTSGEPGHGVCVPHDVCGSP